MWNFCSHTTIGGIQIQSMSWQLKIRQIANQLTSKFDFKYMLNLWFYFNTLQESQTCIHYFACNFGRESCILTANNLNFWPLNNLRVNIAKNILAAWPSTSGPVYLMQTAKLTNCTNTNYQNIAGSKSKTCW